MFHLLIVEDELWLRRRLVETIEWEKYGISKISDAEDGAEALKIALEDNPDILITDIRMPELSGVDLLRALNESSVYPRTIVVSGYDDFEYAQEALRMGAVNYLLKPVEEKELLSSVEKCIAELEKEQKEKLLYEKHFAISELFIKTMYEEFLFETEIYNKKNILLLKQVYEETYFPAKYASVLSIETSTANFFDTDNLETDIWKLFHCVENICETKFKELFQRVYLFIRGNQIVLLVFSDMSSEEFSSSLKQMKDRLTNELKTYVSYSLIIAEGSIVGSLTELHTSYEKAWMNMKNLRKGNNLDGIGSTPDIEINFEDIYADYNCKSIIKEIRNGNHERAIAELNNLLETSEKRLKSIDIVRLRLFYINLINRIASACLPECETNADQLAIQCFNEIKEIINIRAGSMVSQINHSLEVFIGKLTEIYVENNGNKRHWIMDQVLQYVEENYHTALSTKDIAQRFFINASYFSKLFHDQMGCTFSDYLISVRIEKAKVMLTQTNMKLYDIAYAVGYSNVQYFSTIFKEKEGTTPSRYRQLRTNPIDGYGEDIK